MARTFTGPVPPFAVGACQGCMGFTVNGAVGPSAVRNFTLPPTWAAATAAGNLRWIQVTTSDGTFPNVTITDPSGATYAVVGAVAVGQGTVSQNYQGTCQQAAGANQQGGLVFHWPQGATAPNVLIAEYLPP